MQYFLAFIFTLSLLGNLFFLSRRIYSNQTRGEVMGVSTSCPIGCNKVKEYYIPMGLGQISDTNQWMTAGGAQANFDIASYGRVKQAYFEAILRVQSGEIKARLYDTNTPYIYAGNEARSSSYGGELISVPVNLQPGKKNYKVQLYTTIGQGYLDSARIKIVTE